MGYAVDWSGELVVPGLTEEVEAELVETDSDWDHDWDTYGLDTEDAYLTVNSDGEKIQPEYIVAHLERMLPILAAHGLTITDGELCWVGEAGGDYGAIRVRDGKVETCTLYLQGRWPDGTPYNTSKVQEEASNA